MKSVRESANKELPMKRNSPNLLKVGADKSYTGLNVSFCTIFWCRLKIKAKARCNYLEIHLEVNPGLVLANNSI